MPSDATSMDPNYGGYTWQYDAPGTTTGNVSGTTNVNPYGPQQMQDYSWATKAGFQGDPWMTSGSGQDMTSSINPAFQQWTQDQGYQWGYGASPTGYQMGYFGANGQPVSPLEGNANAWKGDTTAGALMMAAIGGFGGAMGAGLGAGATGAASPELGAIPASAWETSGMVAPTAESGAVLDAGLAAPALGAPGAAPSTGLDLSGLTPMASSQPSEIPALTEADAGTMVPGTGGGAPGASGILDAAAPVDSLPQDVVDRALASVTKDPLRTAQVGLTGLGLAKQLSGRGSAQQQFKDVAGPEKAVSTDLLNRFQTGQISGADAFAIQDFTQKQTSQVNDYYARAGLSNSSMHMDALNRVNQQAEQMRQQAVQNLLTGGLKAAGVSDPTLVQGINASLKQDQASQDAMAKFLQMLASMNTPAASPAPAPAPATDTTGSPS